jgi:hypothetical protein
MAIVNAGRPVTLDDIKGTAGRVATMIRNAVQDGEDFRVQLESWPDPDLIQMGLTQPEINAIKGFFVGDLPQIAALLKASTWIKQLLGTGV